MLKPKLDKESFILDHGTQLEIDAEFNDDFLFCADILKVASQRTDPIEFLWENRLHWNINAGRAINYLISEPQFFDKYPAIEFLREIIFLNQFDFIVQELAIIGLGKALNISEFKEKAKSALIDIATTNNVHHLFIDELKLCAQEQLRPLLPEEDIQALFQQIAFKNNLYARSIDFLTSQPVVFDDSMIEFLKRIILLDAYDFNAQEQAIIGLGKALKLPKFKEKAKSALMDIAVPESVNNMYTDELRLCAQEQLRSLLHEEDIQMFFQQLAQANHC